MASALLTRKQFDGLNEIESSVIALNEFLFDFPYNFYDDSEKVEFQKRFIRHFFMREIAFETFARFKLELMNVFQVELPTFNRLFELFNDESWKIKNNVDYDTIYEGSTNNKENWNNDKTNNRIDNLNGRRNLSRNESYKDINNHNLEESSNTQNEQKNAFSDTPQGTLANVENNTYLTDYRNIKDNNNANHEMNENSTLNHTGQLIDSETSTDNRTIKDIENEKKDGLIEGIEKWKKTISGNYGVATNAKQYQEYAENVQSPESLFYALCDKKLFLMTWDL